MSGPEEPPEEEHPAQVPAYPQSPGQQDWPYRPPEQGIQAGPLIGGLVVGLIVGFIASVAMALVVVMFSASLDSTNGVAFVLPQFVPLGVAVFLLAFRRTRMAAAGLVMGIAIGMIVVPGVCVALVGAGGMG